MWDNTSQSQSKVSSMIINVLGIKILFIYSFLFYLFYIYFIYFFYQRIHFSTFYKICCLLLGRIYQPVKLKNYKMLTYEDNDLNVSCK